MSNYLTYKTGTGAIVQEIYWIDPSCIFQKFYKDTFALWLDSADHNKKGGQFSFIALDPFNQLTLAAEDNHPFEKLHAELDQWQESWDGLDTNMPPFRGGAAGFFSYDLGQNLETLPPLKPSINKNLPHLKIGIYDIVLAFDHKQKRTFLFSTGFPEKTLKKRTERASQRIAEMKEHLKDIPPVPTPTTVKLKHGLNFLDAQDYIKKVEKVIKNIQNGDVFQANIAHSISAELYKENTEFNFYLKLRDIAKSPFSAFCQFGDFTIASASPERFLSCQDGKVSTEPIKGTIQKGQSTKEDKENIKHLIESTKDIAENVMIVDLLRNDLAKSCLIETIKVPHLCQIKSFDTIHHLISTVLGNLKPKKTPLNLLKDCFPGGSITGAPKIKAMKIISELETTCRGAYCGCIVSKLLI